MVLTFTELMLLMIIFFDVSDDFYVVDIIDNFNDVVDCDFYAVDDADDVDDVDDV